MVWNRDEILCCHCPEMSSRHMHCPCDSCCGKAVARSTELCHYKAREDLTTVCVGPDLGFTDSIEEQSDLVERDTEAEEQDLEVNIKRVPDEYVFVETVSQAVIAPVEQVVEHQEVESIINQGMKNVKHGTIY